MAIAEIPSLPTNRPTPLDPPSGLRELKDRHGPLCPLAYPDGHVGWLVTSDELARAVLGDARFTARSEFKRVPVSRPGADPFIGQPALPGWFVDMDPPDHTRFRRQIASHFSVRRVEALAPRIKEVVDRHLDEMAVSARPTDFIQSFAVPVPSVVICEVMGVPISERQAFHELTETLFSLDVSADEGTKAMATLNDLVGSLVNFKRRRPSGDLLTSLIQGEALTEPEIIGAAVLLITAGHETVASMLGLGLFALMLHPESIATLVEASDVTANAVEELLRYLTVFHFGVPRAAAEDVEIGESVIRAGQTVTVSLPAANRDPARYEQPDLLDVRRRALGHLAFGFGAHQCIGQSLARMELRLALEGVLRRFPALQLATEPSAVPVSTNSGIYGTHKLLLDWDPS